jgi:hypothetical protein
MKCPESMNSVKKFFWPPKYYLCSKYSTDEVGCQEKCPSADVLSSCVNAGIYMLKFLPASGGGLNNDSLGRPKKEPGACVMNGIKKEAAINTAA